ncbi:MAG: hypothetical protein K0R65_1201 [Crocinitomicaceae bacterium]|jgi:hypothetical protein|nr:hypothetical protein [Crocinitomicaceae bacterium]
MNKKLLSLSLSLFLIQFVVGSLSYAQVSSSSSSGKTGKGIPVVRNGKEMYDVSSKVRMMNKQEEINQMNTYDIKNATTCAGATAVNVSLQDCDDVGTAGFYTTGTNLNFTNAVVTAPTNSGSTAETCAGATGYSAAGTWVRLNPAAGVETLTFSFQTGAAGTGSHVAYAQFFQGTGCGALTAIDCMPILEFDMGATYVDPVYVDNVNPSQDVWAYIWDDASKAFNLEFEVIGSGPEPSNTTCAGASSGASGGCNLGAAPGTFTTPGAAGRACTGGNWGSNENTLYFQITANSTTGSVDMDNVICNDGTAGNAQFGVFNSCACVGTYTAACFRSCAVGTGTISLASLTPGSNYILVVDGFAGDVCVWDFITVGVTLPVELLSINASVSMVGNKLSWKVASERDCDKYILQRSTNPENGYETIAEIDGQGTIPTEVSYEYIDQDASMGTTYYVLTQVDMNGQRTDFAPVSVTNENAKIVVAPNPVSDAMNLKFASKSEGMANISLIDASGKVVSTYSYYAAKGVNELDINTANLNAGVYTVMVVTANDSKQVKIVK